MPCIMSIYHPGRVIYAECSIDPGRKSSNLMIRMFSLFAEGAVSFPTSHAAPRPDYNESDTAERRVKISAPRRAESPHDIPNSAKIVRPGKDHFGNWSRQSICAERVISGRSTRVAISRSRNKLSRSARLRHDRLTASELSFNSQNPKTIIGRCYCAARRLETCV